MALSDAKRQRKYRERQKKKNKKKYMEKEAKQKRDSYIPFNQLSRETLQK